MNHTTVSQPLVLHLLSAEGRTLPLTAELYYDATDPLAITALFDDGGDAPVVWVFARDLLEAGLDRPSGDGDIVIRPALDAHGRAAVHILLTTPHGDALLEASADELETFLAATWRVVPPGSEHRHLDLDLLLATLLAES